MRSATSNHLVLIGLGTVIGLLYLAFSILVPPLSVPGVERPILPLIGMLLIAFVLSLVAMRFAVRLERVQAVWVVLVFSVLFRAMVLPSHPFQEVDIYRYIWDGNVSVAGISPYSFAPADVSAEVAGQISSDIRHLRQLASESEGLRRVLEQVHFPHLRTPYPPVSQAAFALAAVCTPQDASFYTHLLVMKLVVSLFDVGALLILIKLLIDCGKPVGLAIAYGWNPLILKEFANSGHLDSVAVFFTILTIAFVRAWLWTGKLDIPTARKEWFYGIGTVISVGLAVAAKLYPIVLFPLLLAVVWRRRSWRIALPVAAMAAAMTALSLAPMFAGAPTNDYAQTETGNSGISAFLRSWEINDFLFLIIVENMKTPEQIQGYPEAWFSVIPLSFRESLQQSSRSIVGDRGALQAFFLARLLTAVAFVLIALTFCARYLKRNTWDEFSSAVFLTFAWFWLLAPTQNPWYWSWAAVFLPFVRLKSWLLISGFSLIYYTRFWFEYHFPDTALLGTEYRGTVFFDLVVTWIEFLPPLLVLGRELLLARRDARNTQNSAV